MKFKKLLFFIISISTIFSACVGDVDFDQAENIVIEPEFKVALVHFRAIPENFIDSLGIDLFSITDITDIHHFDSGAAQENTVKIILKFEIENKFEKEFNLRYNFLNEFNQTTKLVSIHVDPVSVNSNIINLADTIVGVELESFLISKKVRVTAEVIANAGVTTANMFLDYKSAADVFLRIDANDN